MKNGGGLFVGELDVISPSEPLPAAIMTHAGGTAGLTPAQVSQIHFVNPPGMPAGTYPGRILATGEVVPGTRPALSMTRSPNRMISWSGNYQLFSSTNVLGPYTAIEDATSPYAVLFSEPRRFFYLRSP